MIILVSVIGLLFDLPVMIAYGMFSSAMPRSGGDYVYISRTFLPYAASTGGCVERSRNGPRINARLSVWPSKRSRKAST